VRGWRPSQTPRTEVPISDPALQPFGKAEFTFTKPVAVPEPPPGMSQPPEGYGAWLVELKSRIHAAQQRATLAVNRELVLLYWQIGRDILARQAEQGWGTKVIDRLALDLRTAFPDMKGFSPRNLKYMRAFAEAWPDAKFVQEVLAQLPWYHQLALLDKLPGPETRKWYAAKALEHNWSRNVLVMQIETRLLERSGAAATNFELTLPRPQSDLAQESLKDPYKLDFLGLTDEAQERAVEGALVKHVTEFLLELGVADYQLVESLPPELQTSLPSIEQIERELAGNAESSNDEP
jgi:predicted nuclease of restriction endonuclease-like (RecB) superfamily